jgi:hypothetical protein
MYCRWLSSRRTMIRSAPVCGPLPSRYSVSGLPEGSMIVNETSVGRPGRTGPAGVSPARWNVRAATMVGALEPELEPQPAVANAIAAGVQRSAGAA